jgi:hypothetical protein
MRIGDERHFAARVVRLRETRNADRRVEAAVLVAARQIERAGVEEQVELLAFLRLAGRGIGIVGNLDQVVALPLSFGVETNPAHLLAGAQLHAVVAQLAFRAALFFDTAWRTFLFEQFELAAVARVAQRQGTC